MPKIVTVDTAACTVSVYPANIQSDGEDEAIITVTCLNDDGNPMGGLAAASVVPSSTGTNNTITAIDTHTDQSGVITFTMTSTSAQVKTISVAICGATITDTAALTVEGVVVPDFGVEFNDYADIAAVDSDSGSGLTFMTAETGGPWSNFSLQSLETSLLGDKALRHNFPDRTTFIPANGYDPGEALSARYSDFYIIRGLKNCFNDAGTVTECWAEIDMSFSGPLGDGTSAFATTTPASWAGDPVANSDYKWLFLVTNASRFSYKVGYAGVYYPDGSDVAIPEGPTATRFRWDCTAPGQGDGDNNFIGPNIFDGERHVVRIYAKVGAGTGAQKLWLDGTLLYSDDAINTGSSTSLTNITLGNNLNCGSDRDMYCEYYGVKLWFNTNNPGWT